MGPVDIATSPFKITYRLEILTNNQVYIYVSNNDKSMHVIKTDPFLSFKEANVYLKSAAKKCMKGEMLRECGNDIIFILYYLGIYTPISPPNLTDFPKIDLEFEELKEK